MTTPEELARLHGRAMEALVEARGTGTVIDPEAEANVPQVAIEGTNGHSVVVGSFTVAEQERQINLDHPDSILQRAFSPRIAPMVVIAPSHLSVAFQADAARAFGAFLIAAADLAEGS